MRRIWREKNMYVKKYMCVRQFIERYEQLKKERKRKKQMRSTVKKKSMEYIKEKQMIKRNRE